MRQTMLSRTSLWSNAWDRTLFFQEWSLSSAKLKTLLVVVVVVATAFRDPSCTFGRTLLKRTWFNIIAGITSANLFWRWNAIMRFIRHHFFFSFFLSFSLFFFCKLHEWRNYWWVTRYDYVKSSSCRIIQIKYLFQRYIRLYTCLMLNNAS